MASSTVGRLKVLHGQMHSLLVLPSPTVTVSGKPEQTKSSRSTEDSDSSSMELCSLCHRENSAQERTRAAVVMMLPGFPTIHFGMPGFESWIHTSF